MNRRAFLVNSTVAGAGLSLAAPLLAQPVDGASDELRVGLIGAGLQGETLVSACLNTVEVARVRFAAVCDVWENLNLARMVELLGQYDHRPRVHTDFRKMLKTEKNLDAVLIATPDHCHAAQSIACLEAGVPVYCEAPMANNREDARAMVKAARATGKALQIGYQRRSNPLYRHCREPLLNTVRLPGRLIAVNGQSNHSAEADLGWSRRRVLDDAVLRELGYPSMHAFKNWRGYRRWEADRCWTTARIRSTCSTGFWADRPGPFRREAARIITIQRRTSGRTR